jgi:hypothetical protein
MLARELIPAIRTRLEKLDAETADGHHNGLASGRRAALWRAQQRAARIEVTVEDLRSYCLDSLRSWQVLDERDENDYLRGYRQGFQHVLTEIRRMETGRRS